MSPTLPVARSVWEQRVRPLVGPVLRALAHPSRLLIGVAGTAVIANAIALAAPGDTSSVALDGGRMGAALKQAANDRDRAEAAQRQKLDMREKALKASEARLAGEVRQAGGQGTPAGSSGGTAKGGAGPQPDVPYDRLAAIYQRMKPGNAAPIFERLDLEVQTQVARRMRDQVTAQILARMSPDAAVKLSMSLAGRKVIEAAPKPSLARAGDKEGKASTNAKRK